jgi:hypothetical protein
MTRISNRLKRLSGPGSHINPVRMDAKPEAVHERVADSRICLRAEGSRRLPIFVDNATHSAHFTGKRRLGGPKILGNGEASGDICSARGAGTAW